MSSITHIPGVKDIRESLLRHPEKSYSYRSISAIQKIAVHHSLSKGGSARSFARYHVNHNSWPGIGYHFVIEKNGDLMWCNDLEVKCYHVGKSNEKAVGICIVGDFQEQILEERQSLPLLKLLDYLLKELSLRADDVWGHSEFENYDTKSCPCIDMGTLRRRLAGRTSKTFYQKFPVGQLLSSPGFGLPFNLNEISTRPGESVIAAAQRFRMFNLGDIKTRNRDLDLKKTRKENISIKVKGPVEKVPREIQQFIRIFDQKGFLLFREDHKPFNLNVVGVRNNSTASNTFDDEVCVFWKYYGKWNIKRFKATTDPGLTYLRAPINEAGTAILKEGQYRAAFKIGMHRNKYTALVQAAPLTVIRDFNEDDRLDFSSGVEQTGFFGINIHRASSTGESTMVNKWSAGCQVFSNIHHFNEFIRICRRATREWGELLTYTLLRKSDLNHVA